MTAKEIAELAKQIVSVNRGERGNEYVFSYGLLKDFINQLCKEQREKDIEITKNYRYLMSAYVYNQMKGAILSNKQPEVL